VTINYPERMILRGITGREELGHGTLLAQYSVRQITDAAVLPANNVFPRNYVVTHRNVVGHLGLDPFSLQTRSF
jgi:hypothetical protein